MFMRIYFWKQATFFKPLFQIGKDQWLSLNKRIMLTASGLKKSYRSLPVLRGVNLSVEKGSIVAIVGASGAGKSTLLHILGSLDSPSEGEVKINGTNLFAQPAKSLADFRNKNLG